MGECKMTTTVENKVIFDSNDYINEEDWEFVELDLAYLLLENVRKPRGQVVGYVFLSKRHSHYGSISNHGQTGYKKVDQANLTRAILSMSSSDSFKVFGENGILKVNYYDHDGTHECEIKPITKSRADAVEGRLDDFDKLIDYVKTMPSVKVK